MLTFGIWIFITHLKNKFENEKIYLNANSKSQIGDVLHIQCLAKCKINNTIYRVWKEKKVQRNIKLDMAHGGLGTCWLLQQMDNNSRRLACWKRVPPSFLRCDRDYDQIRDDSHKVPWETKNIDSAIRNPGRLDTVSFCGVLVDRPRESEERSVRRPSREPHVTNALTLCNCNPLATIDRTSMRETSYVDWNFIGHPRDVPWRVVFFIFLLLCTLLHYRLKFILFLFSCFYV